MGGTGRSRNKMRYLGTGNKLWMYAVEGVFERRLGD